LQLSRIPPAETPLSTLTPGFAETFKSMRGCGGDLLWDNMEEGTPHG